MFSCRYSSIIATRQEFSILNVIENLHSRITAALDFDLRTDSVDGAAKKVDQNSDIVALNAWSI